MEHTSVLAQETLEYLNLSPDGILVDCTLGLGGHTSRLLTSAGSGAQVIAFELDEENLSEAQERLLPFESQVTYIRDNFVHLREHIEESEFSCVTAILFDLGLSSPHVDKGARGFSFLREGPLDMRFDTRGGRTAADLIQRLSPREFTRILKEYGEEPQARKIAEAIIKCRKSQPFKTTTQLADFIEDIIPRRGKEHPATKTFQALRIAVNDELGVLSLALQDAVQMLCPGGRIVVISYHSLEDRIVKNIFRTYSSDRELLRSNRSDHVANKYQESSRSEHILGQPDLPVLKLLTKKPLVPSEEEIRDNPRARSAKFRAAEKLAS